MEVCPIGFFCFDRNTFLLIIVSFIIIVVYYIQKNNRLFDNIKMDLNYSKKDLESQLNTYKSELDSIKQDVSYKQTVNVDRDYNATKDLHRLINPLLPPERSYPYRLNGLGMPINITTRGPSSGYQQVGVLIEEGVDGASKKILPLYGEQTYNGSNQWKYYTNTDGFQAVKLPVTNKNRNCQDTYGCDEIYDGNMVSVDPYSNQYRASIYKLDSPKYIPYIF